MPCYIKCKKEDTHCMHKFKDLIYITCNQRLFPSQRQTSVFVKYWTPEYFLVSVGANVALVNIVNRGHLWVLQRRVDRGGSRCCNCVILELFSQSLSGLLSNRLFVPIILSACVFLLAFANCVVFRKSCLLVGGWSEDASWNIFPLYYLLIEIEVLMVNM